MADINKWVKNLIGKDLDRATKIAKKYDYKVYKHDPEVEYDCDKVIIVETKSEVPVAPKGYEICAFGPVDTVTKIVSF